MQNINLYAGRRVQRAPLFSRAGVGALAALLLISIASLHTLEKSRIDSLQRQLAAAEQESVRLQKLLAQVPQLNADAGGKVAAEEREVAGLEALAARLASGGRDQASGFTAQLRAFGRATADGVWLTGISLNNTAATITLEGRALEPARIPALIETLRREPTFKGTAFAALELKSVDGAGGAADKSRPLTQFKLVGADSRSGTVLAAARTDKK